MRRTKILNPGAFLCAASLLLGVSVTQAEELWTPDANKQTAAAEAENRIIRWCAESGDHVRFASANIQLTGYQPCGELNVPVTCDPSGRRMIGKGGETPYAYKDCSTGPRIYIESDHAASDDSEEPEADSSEGLAALSKGPERLSTRERSDLKSEMKAAEKAQDQSMEIQLQKVLDLILNTMLSNRSLSGTELQRSGALPKMSKSQIDEMLRYVDPAQQKQLRRILSGK